MSIKVSINSEFLYLTLWKILNEFFPNVKAFQKRRPPLMIISNHFSLSSNTFWDLFYWCFRTLRNFMPINLNKNFMKVFIGFAIVDPKMASSKNYFSFYFLFYKKNVQIIYWNLVHKSIRKRLQGDRQRCFSDVTR